MDYENIILEKKDGHATVTLSRPQRLNALNSQLLSELDDAFVRIEAMDDVNVVVLTGSGDRAFSAGGDIHEMVAASEQELLGRRKQFYDCTWRVMNLRQPVIGAINGIAHGGGAWLASVPDIRIGCERTNFRFLAVSYGQLNSSWTLPMVVGMPMAKELLYTGREVGAEEALRIGLLNRLVSPEKVLAEAESMASLIAKNDAMMVQGVKELLHQGIGAGLKEGFDNEQEALRTRLKTRAPKEGFAPFFARKKAE